MCESVNNEYSKNPQRENKYSEQREIKCKGAGQCDHSGVNCDENNNCGEFEAITSDPVKKWPIDEARDYIYKLSKTDFEDTNFCNYIQNRLAGDFALEISNVIKSLKEKLSAVVSSNTELLFLNAELQLNLKSGARAYTELKNKYDKLLIENEKKKNCMNCGNYEDCGTEKHNRCQSEKAGFLENWRPVIEK